MADNMTTSDIVVGVDGSDESFAALRWALREAQLTGQRVNAVYGWTRSWDMGSEPDSEEGWERLRARITERLRTWVDEAVSGLDDVDGDDVTLTSMHASGTAALLRIGKDAQQIVVGRRSLGRVARWFTGSFSASLAEEATVPVTVVRIFTDEDESMQDAIANALTPGDAATGYARPESGSGGRPVVVGVDGSATSRRALEFAAHEAHVHGVPLHVLFCWQLKDLGVVPGYENAVAPVAEGQKRAEQLLDGIMRDDDSLFDGVEVQAHAFHISAAKGLIAASRYASHLVVGSRGLSGFDAHFLGSVSKQLVTLAECTLTVVH
ncbi:universal stress protein [Bifidobacterium ramosum]|uniref:Universal stress protein n=1 Tax=Bifidobacterium ramosum TaxID=1798158 RepID=A0A6L4X073_9BIFI|nr:universal stress protein [Bifidobacterium ramosum]KAB8287865.1 universal stress protein [Bifidobacterium ramosum]NEG71187.1 universal stress protein [Bifidobacterium ramosum]